MKADTKRAVALILLVCHWGAMLHSQAPEWWVARQARDPLLAPDDYALINQGQLKQLARAAFLEMEARTPGGAGPQITALVQSWLAPATTPRDDYAVVNLGQLKAVAAPFHARLQDLGVAVPYTWTAATTDDDDFAPANIGQAKALFAFAIPDADALLPPEVLAYKNTYGGLFGEDSPFVIHYADWRCNIIDPSVEETRSLGWTETWQWHLPQGDQAWPQAQKLSTQYSAIPQGMSADDWINSHTDPVPPFTQRMVDLELEHTYTPDPALVTRIQEFEILRQFAFPGGQPLDFNRQLKQVWWVHSAATGESLWESLYPGVDYTAKLASHGSHRYETPAQTWRSSGHDPIVPLLPPAPAGNETAPHQLMFAPDGGTLTRPVSGWSRPPVVEVDEPLPARVLDGPPIPLQPLKVPASGGFIASARSYLETRPMHHLPPSGQPALVNRYHALHSRGRVVLSWRPGLRPQDMTAQVMQNWINRYRVVIEQTVHHADGTHETLVESVTNLQSFLSPSSSSAQLGELQPVPPQPDHDVLERAITLRLENLVPVVQDPNGPNGTGGPNGPGNPGNNPNPVNPEIFSVYLEGTTQAGYWSRGSKYVTVYVDGVPTDEPTTFSNLSPKLIKPAEGGTHAQYYWRISQEDDWAGNAVHHSHAEPASDAHTWTALGSLPVSPARALDRNPLYNNNARPQSVTVARFTPSKLDAGDPPPEDNPNLIESKAITYYAEKVRLKSTHILPAGYEQSFILVKEAQKPPPYAPGQYDQTVLGTHQFRIEPGDDGFKSPFTQLVNFTSNEIAKAHTENQKFDLRLLPMEVDLAIPKVDADTTLPVLAATNNNWAVPSSGSAEVDLTYNAWLVPKEKRATEGGWVVLNFDDDDGRGNYAHGNTSAVSDLDYTGAISNENDLIRVGIKKLDMGGQQVSYRFKFNSPNIRLWKKANRSEQVQSEQTEITVSGNNTYAFAYVEGIKAHDDDDGTMITGQIKIGNGNWVDGDKVKVRVAQPIVTLFMEGRNWLSSDGKPILDFVKGRMPTVPAGQANANDPNFGDRDPLFKRKMTGISTNYDTFLVPGKTWGGKDVCFSVTVLFEDFAYKAAKLALKTEGAHVAFNGHANWGVGFAFGTNFGNFNQFYWAAGGGQASCNTHGFHEHLQLSPWNDTLTPGFPQPNFAAAQIWNGMHDQNAQNRLIQGIPVPNIQRFPNMENPVVQPGQAFQHHKEHMMTTSLQEMDLLYHYTADPAIDGDDAGDHRSILKQPGNSDVPANLKYKSLMLTQCNSYRSFIESFKHGRVIGTWNYVSNPNITRNYIRNTVDGKTAAEMKADLDSLEAGSPTGGRPSMFEISDF